MSTSMSIEKISAIVISVAVVLVLAYLAIVEHDAQATTALIALASPAAAVAIIRRDESEGRDTVQAAAPITVAVTPPPPTA